MRNIDNSLKARFRRKPMLTAIGVAIAILYAADAVRDFATGFERGYNEQRLGQCKFSATNFTTVFAESRSQLSFMSSC